MSVFFTVLTFLFILVSLALVLVILVQRPQGGGLASAFGGGGGTDTAFGGRTGDALTVGTVSYLILAMALNIFDPQPAPTTAQPTVTESTSQSTLVTPSAAMPGPDGITTTGITVTPVTTPATTPSTTPAKTDGSAPATAAPAVGAPMAAPTPVSPTNPAPPQQS
ncbi:hypothetical protein LBMAG50_01650 [Phycisphaerae bacterium]|nr:hypothetical protein LBMAG50_01650 [Phycisphaerae bacterium]